MKIRSNRKKIITRWLMVLCGGVGLALFVEATGILNSSAAGRFAAETNLPVIGLLIVGCTLMLIVVPAKQNWTHLMTLNDDHIEIREGLGTLKIPYTAIANVIKIPMYGAGIQLQESSLLSQYLQATPSNVEKILKISAATVGGYGCEVCILDKHIEIGSDAFVNLLQDRIKSTK